MTKYLLNLLQFRSVCSLCSLVPMFRGLNTYSLFEVHDVCARIFLVGFKMLEFSRALYVLILEDEL